MFGKTQEIIDKAPFKKKLALGGGALLLTSTIGLGTAAILANETSDATINSITKDGVAITFTRKGNIRHIEAVGDNLEAVHQAASNNFSKYLESDFKSNFRTNSIDSKSFRPFISFEKGKYRMAYEIELVPKSIIDSQWNKTEKYIRIVDVRGSIIHGKNNPKAQVEKNLKQIIPRWQSGMAKIANDHDANMQYISRDVEVKINGSSMYHKVYLGVGVKNTDVKNSDKK